MISTPRQAKRGTLEIQFVSCGQTQLAGYISNAPGLLEPDQTRLFCTNGSAAAPITLAVRLRQKFELAYGL